MVAEEKGQSSDEGIRRYQPPRKVEQRITITRGPYDPGGQPFLETENKLQLGLFGWNAAAGCSITKAALLDSGKYRDYWTWDRSSHLIKEAERIGLEFVLPTAGWQGCGGEIDFHEDSLDGLVMAYALAQVTAKIVLMSSVSIGSHLHPLHIARFGANCDHLSDGRWGLNIISGWNRGELEFFGLDKLDYRLRYEIGDEFLTLIKHAWAMTTPFQFEGQFFQSQHSLIVGPKPTRRPRPFLLHAGYSPEGLDFAAKQCDWLLCRSPRGDRDDLKDVAQRAKELALLKYGRELKAFAPVYIVMAETDERAREEFEMLASMIDTEAADRFIRRVLSGPGEFEGVLPPPDKPIEETSSPRDMIGEENYVRMALGLGAIHVIGSYDAVAEQLGELATEYGQDGVLCSFFDPLLGLHELDDEVIPRLRKMGLRR